jgi:hypothetical protein
VTPSGIETATFRLGTQCLNQLRHRFPLTVLVFNEIMERNGADSTLFTAVELLKT